MSSKQNCPFDRACYILWLFRWGYCQGSFKGDVDIDVDVDVEVDVDIDSYFGCLKGVSKSVQVLSNAVVVQTLIILN